MCRLISAAERASTSSKSSEAFTSSPISASVASTSAETSSPPVAAVAAVFVSVGFMQSNYYSRRAELPFLQRFYQLVCRARAPLLSESRLRFLHDFHAPACANPRRPGFHHLQQVVQRAHPAGSFHSHIGANHAPQQRHIRQRRPAAPESRRCLYKIRPRLAGQPARAFLFFLRQQARFENHLANGSARMGCLHDAPNISQNRRVVA